VIILPSVDKVKEATQKLIELFKSGNLPPAIARTTIRAKAGHEVPSDSWSLGNRLLMLLAGTEDARGFKQWQKVGRKVKKGAKAFYILAPRMVKTEDNTTGEEKLVIAGFLSVPVFRYEHTEGEEIIYPDYSPPALPPLSDVAEHYGIKVRYGAFSGRFYGAYTPSKDDILLCSHDEEVFFHELAHAVHNTIKPLKGGQDPYQEIVAETVAAVLCIMYGFEGSLYDAKKYIEGYARGKDPLRAIMRVLSDVENVLERIFEVKDSIAVQK
jgi:antirestriction protein ArdC